MELFTSTETTVSSSQRYPLNLCLINNIMPALKVSWYRNPQSTFIKKPRLKKKTIEKKLRIYNLILDQKKILGIPWWIGHTTLLVKSHLKLSLSHKLWFLNLYIFSTWWCNPLIFYTWIIFFYRIQVGNI